MRESTSWREAGLATLAIFLFGCLLGYLYPVLSLSMQLRGITEVAIGWNASMMGVGVLLSALTLPRLCREVAGSRLVALSFVGTSLSVYLLTISQDIYFWAFLRTLIGFFANTVFVITEVWANSSCVDRERGRTMAIYTTGLSLGFTIGPGAVYLTGVQGHFPLLFCAAVAGTCGLAFLCASRTHTEMVAEGSVRGVVRFVRCRWIIFSAAMAFGLSDWISMSITPMYFVDVGYSIHSAAAAVSVSHIGMILLQWPIGVVLDRCNREVVAAVLAGGTALCAALIVGFPGVGWVTWASIFFIGGFSCGVYTTALSLLGQNSSNTTLVHGSTALSVGYTLAGSFGLLSSGILMYRFEPVAIFVLLGVVYFALVTMFGVSFLRRQDV